jgi:hypothetical protein
VFNRFGLFVCLFFYFNISISRSSRSNVTASVTALLRLCWLEPGAVTWKRLTWTSLRQTLMTRSMLTLRTCMFVLFIRASHVSPICTKNSLLDPSCSGSGIINRLDHLVESGTFCRPYGFRTGGSLTYSRLLGTDKRRKAPALRMQNALRS